MSVRREPCMCAHVRTCRSRPIYEFRGAWACLRMHKSKHSLIHAQACMCVLTKIQDMRARAGCTPQLQLAGMGCCCCAVAGTRQARPWEMRMDLRGIGMGGGNGMQHQAPCLPGATSTAPSSWATGCIYLAALWAGAAWCANTCSAQQAGSMLWAASADS